MGNQVSINLKWNTEERKGEVPNGREGAIMFGFGDFIYLLFGGSSSPEGPTQYQDLFVFDTKTGEWSKKEMKGEVPLARTGCAYALVSNNLYVFGGINADQGWLNDLSVMNIETLEWKSLPRSDAAPSPRDKLSCSAIGSTLYFFGGFGPQNTPSEEEDDDEEAVTFGWFQDTFAFDTNTLSWKKIDTTGTPPSARAAYGMCAIDNKIFIFGGRDNTQRTNDLYCLDTQTFTWKCCNPYGFLPSPRSFHTCTRVGNRILLFGGLNPSNVHLNDTYVLFTEKEDEMTWVNATIEGAPPASRGSHSAVVMGDKLYVFGGSAEFDESTHECKVYRDDLLSLDLTPVINAPTPQKPADNSAPQ